MSAHPNVLLLLVLTPRKMHDGIDKSGTFARILRDAIPDGDPANPEILVGKERYSLLLMEDGYDEPLQIEAVKGQIILVDFVTYGWGDWIDCDELERRKQSLAAWAHLAAKRYDVDFTIRVTANYY